MEMLVCAMLALLYVGVLYVPPFLLQLRPRSQRELLLQRFVCATLVSVIAPASCLFLLPVKDFHFGALLKVFGLRTDHLLQATFLPLFLTATLYMGPLFLEAIDAAEEEEMLKCKAGGGGCLKSSFQAIMNYALEMGDDVFAWRNYVVAPLSEEIVFRGCMASILLCGGYSPYAVVLICPFFFSIAHMHRVWELIHHERYSKHRAVMVVGAQLGYTVIFGWYAAFIFLRTGHLAAAVVPHIFCNVMGFPNILKAFHNRVVGGIFVMGLLSFLGLIFPLTNPSLYNDEHKSCNCWQALCTFS